jgi:hypothetical protein
MMADVLLYLWPSKFGWNAKKVWFWFILDLGSFY